MNTGKTAWVAVVITVALVLWGSPAGAGGGHGRYGGYYYPYHGHYYSGGDVFLGATLGFVLGAALAPSYVYYAPPPYYYAPAPAYFYAPPPRVVYREPPAVVYQSPPRDSDCLQTREYTTTVNIGGRPVQAWGTRCLRPDGTWSYGPFQTAPEE